MVVHRMLVTRVEFTIALREHFSLPFIFAQFAVMGEYMNAKTRAQEVRESGRQMTFARNQIIRIFQKLHLAVIFALTFLLTITWQFAQFVLFLQALVIFGLALIGVLDKGKVKKELQSFNRSSPFQ